MKISKSTTESIILTIITLAFIVAVVYGCWSVTKDSAQKASEWRTAKYIEVNACVSEGGEFDACYFKAYGSPPED